jgi:regulator of sigma E protease
VAGTIESMLNNLVTTASGGNFAADFSAATVAWAPAWLLAQSSEPSLIASILNSIWLVFLVAVGVGLVIFVHELGHFLAAKWCGVKVEKFYVGFDFPIQIGPIRFPRTLGKFRYGETEYGIGTIPLGGYVKMLGQDDDPRRMEEEARRIRMESGDETDGPTDNETDIEQPVKLDPRSFPAKSVWQRMLIISAGVIMNLITGVMFATAAFLYGVPYQPAVVGDTTPGSPAYQAGIQPGGKVIAVGGIRKDDQLHFTDMAASIMLEGTENPDRPVSVAIEYPDGVREYDLKTAAVAAQPGRRMIGLSIVSTTFLPSNAKRLALRDSAAAGALTPEDAGAEVVAIDGVPVPGSGNRDNVQGSVFLHRTIIANPSQSLTLGLLRKDNTTAEVVIPPQPMLMPGFNTSVGPVVGVVKGSPADQAGIQPGDLLVGVEGVQSLGAFSLPAKLIDRQMPVKMSFRRGDGDTAKTIEVELAPTEPVRTTSPVNSLTNAVALDRFGFAYEALAKVDTPSGDDSPFIAGDVLKSVAVAWPGGVVPPMFQDDAYAPLLKRLTKGWEFNAEYTLSVLVDLWQVFPVGTELTVTVNRDGKILDVISQLTPTGDHWFDRGLRFAELERIQVASGMGNALALGLGASQRRLTEIFRLLGMLVTRKANANMIGGPITIFRFAGQEASRGIPTLLMFLTLLSMNLAILNFLPIPALDGGHMVFLTAEAVLGRPINEKLQMQLTMAGVLALLSLMAFAIFNDLRRWQ